MEFDYISIKITGEKEPGAPEFNKFGASYVATIELTLGGLYVSYFQCDVREAGVFGRLIHQHIGRRCI